MTNADHIRAMTDEEMVEYWYDDSCPPSTRCLDVNPDCKECWREWLKQPRGARMAGDENDGTPSF